MRHARAEERLAQRSGHGSLAHARGAGEEHAQRPLHVVQAQRAAAQRACHHALGERLPVDDHRELILILIPILTLILILILILIRPARQ